MRPTCRQDAETERGSLATLAFQPAAVPLVSPTIGGAHRNREAARTSRKMRLRCSSEYAARHHRANRAWAPTEATLTQPPPRLPRPAPNRCPGPCRRRQQKGPARYDLGCVAHSCSARDRNVERAFVTQGESEACARISHAPHDAAGWRRHLSASRRRESVRTRASRYFACL